MRHLSSILLLGLSVAFVGACADDSSPKSSYSPPKAAEGTVATDPPPASTETPGTPLPETGNSTALTWENIRPISQKFCEDCHLDDGFSRLETWSTLKDAAIARLKLGGERGTMPPAETTLGKTMTAEEKQKLISWLETLNQTDREEIGDVSDPAANTKITGDLKLMAETYCVSCHADGRYLKYWINAKAEAIKRIDNRSMPPGRVLPAADKDKLIKALRAL